MMAMQSRKKERREYLRRKRKRKGDCLVSSSVACQLSSWNRGSGLCCKVQSELIYGVLWFNCIILMDLLHSPPAIPSSYSQILKTFRFFIPHSSHTGPFLARTINTQQTPVPEPRLWVVRHAMKRIIFLLLQVIYNADQRRSKHEHHSLSNQDITSPTFSTNHDAARLRKQEKPRRSANVTG